MAMISIPITSLLHNFSLFAASARNGHAMIITFHGREWGILAPMSVLTDEETETFERVSATDAYRNLSQHVGRVHEGEKIVIVGHNIPKCCMLPMSFLPRVQRKTGQMAVTSALQDRGRPDTPRYLYIRTGK